MRQVTEQQQEPAPQLLASCRHIEATLQPSRRHSLWNDVGTMVHFPASSTVLQRRHDYRTVFQHYNWLRLGSRFPLGTKDVRRLLDVKDIATLYELWCFLAVVEAVEAAVKSPPTSAARVGFNDFGAGIEWETRVEWASGIAVTYNPTFARSKATARRSYSVPMRPDILLEVPRDGTIEKHVFDAKFKVDWKELVHETAEQPSDSKEPARHGAFSAGDVHVMHAYRDALSLGSAWVLYPGTKFTFFDRNGSLVGASDKLKGCPRGVGACPLDVRHATKELLRVVHSIVSVWGEFVRPNDEPVRCC